MGEPVYTAQMTMASRVAAAAVFLTAALVPNRALACVCSPGIVDFKDAARAAPLVVAARVVDSQPLKRPDGVVASIDVEVIQLLRGREDRTRFRVWDQMPGGSCSKGLSTLKRGTLLVLALYPPYEPSVDVWKTHGIEPKAGDHLLEVCMYPWQTFADEGQLQKYVKSEAWREI